MKKLFFMFAVLLLFTVTANSSVARSAPINAIADQSINTTDAELLNQDLLVVVGSTTNTRTLFALKDSEVGNVSLEKVSSANLSNNTSGTLQLKSLRTGNNSSTPPEGTVCNSEQVNLFDVENFTGKNEGLFRLTKWPNYSFYLKKESGKKF